MKLVGMMLLLAGMAITASATAVPEIDASSGASALALLSGGLLILRSRRKQ
jgi:hypothetical protein